MSEAETAPPVRPEPRPSRRARRWAAPAAEVLLAFATALLFTAWSGSIPDNPIRRSGQVSGLAALQVGLSVVTLVVVVAVGLTAAYATKPVRKLAVRLAAAVVAGLSTGFLAGGQVFALSGTPWPINADHGDNGSLVLFAREVIATGSTHSFYPPGLPYLMAWASEWFGYAHPALPLKLLLIGFLAITGPAAYVAWRLTRGPLAALALAVVSLLPQVMPYKSYSTFVLVLLVPLGVAVLTYLRGSHTYSVRGSLGRGAGLGLVLGLLFVLYSGWFVWAAPGLVVAGLVTVPWRSGRPALGRAGLFLGAAGLTFLVVTARYLWVMAHSLGTKDPYCSPITLTQPAYLGPLPFANRQWDQAGEWPPFGWFAGLDLFMVLLLVGLGVAIAVGLRSPLVYGPLAIFGGAWMTRFWIAHHLERDRAEQLFPRTTNVLQICLYVLLVAAAILLADRIRRAIAELRRAAGVRRAPATSFAATGVVLVVALLSGMAGSALTDQYLPELPKYQTGGELAWFAHQLREPNGSCPTYANKGTCHDPRPFKPLPEHADNATTTAPANFFDYCEYAWRQTSH